MSWSTTFDNHTDGAVSPRKGLKIQGGKNGSEPILFGSIIAHWCGVPSRGSAVRAGRRKRDGSVEGRAMRRRRVRDANAVTVLGRTARQREASCFCSLARWANSSSSSAKPVK